MADSPFDDPVPRGLGVVQATLRITVALVCWGWAARYLHLQTASPVAGLLETWLKLGAPQVAKAESITAYALIAAGALTLLRPCWFVTFPVFLWLTLAAVGVGFHAPAHKPLVGLEYMPGGTAALALILIDFWPPKLKFSLGMHASGLWLLRISCGTAFIAQGIHAVIQSQFGGDWFAIMQQALEKLSGKEFTDRDVRFALAMMGAIDIAAGFAFLIRRSRMAALSATLWGIVAAGFFTVASGETMYPETLTRAALVGGPATLFCHWWLAIQEQPATVIAKSEFR